MDALLLVNFQNEFIGTSGMFHSSSGIIEKVVNFVDTCRDANCSILHSPLVINENDCIKSPLEESCVSNRNRALRTRMSFEIPSKVKYLPQDIILSGRSGPSAFLNTNLRLIIQENNITRLFIVGFTTDESIHETAKDCANTLGTDLEIYIVEDCCIAETQQKHLDAINSLECFSNVIITEEAKLLLESDVNLVEINSVFPTKTIRPRILVLHGDKCNNDVTKLQLQNLNINEKDFDIFYHNGPIKVFEADSSLEGIVHGPFYSWFDTSSDQDLARSVIAAVHDVLHTMKAHGPFHGIYGFSSGAIVSTLVAGIKNDIELIKKVTTYNAQHFYQTGHDISLDLSLPKLEFVILACAASTITFQNLRELVGLKAKLVSFINISSFHLIGINDDHKNQSEYVATLYSNCQIRYMPFGHNVGRVEVKDLHDFAKSCGSLVQKLTVPPFTPISDISSMAVLPSHQVVLVNIDSKICPKDATILSVLKSYEPEKPFICMARTLQKSTSYGEVFNFIRGGKGDLRRLGVNPGEVVAFCTPPGASAALVFLSICAQTIAAPLDPSLSRIETLAALDQLDARHLILFEDVECPGIAEAFAEFAQFSGAILHTAIIIGDDCPGVFEYQRQCSSLEDQLPLLHPENGKCLLLRTSGASSSQPKTIPLTQKSLIINAHIIAESLQLNEMDVCYSILPLFHIGGISASILSTMVSGGTICCEEKQFNPEVMVDALATSIPQPTWYSGIPTIHNSVVAYLREIGTDKHNSYGIDSNGIWKSGHALRMIRSGTAALQEVDGNALSLAFGGLPVHPTYSMSEQMPIAQPPAGKDGTLTTKPKSVGVPVAATAAILNPSTLLPQPPGVQGEIAISGLTMMQSYLNNQPEDAKSFIYLTLPLDEPDTKNKHDLPQRFFLTGDLGYIDNDGFLYLMGRSKELIKKGGEQISPLEVEEILIRHPWTQTVVCFAVQSALYGEEVGCALVLSSNAPKNVRFQEIIMKMRSFLKEAEFALLKWPTKWKICEEGDLPKTATNKYKRLGLAKVLGFEDSLAFGNSMRIVKTTKAKIDWNAINGFRFLLVTYVMFTHIGSNSSWGHVSNLRRSPWHVHTVLLLGGFSLTATMSSSIPNKFQYFMVRIGNMYPMYFVALLFCLVNLLLVCRPGTFEKKFHWSAQYNDLYYDDGSLVPPFCEGTPAIPTSYWKNLISTIVIHALGLSATPFWFFSWWLGYYLWFTSIYYQCLAAFPTIYNILHSRTRRNTKLLLKLIIAMLVLNAALLISVWFIFLSDSLWQKSPTEHADGHVKNALFLSFYLFGPFWIIYFMIGALLAFLYDALQPSEKHSVYIWGWVADIIALVFVVLSMAHISQGTATNWFMRVHNADSHSDSAIANRLWDNIYGRLLCPLTTVFIFAIATGQGNVTKLLGSKKIVEVLAPHSYNCILFHQQIGQWYFMATRNGSMWNWWNYRKPFYWFSPQPLPVEWYEFFTIVYLTILFSNFIASFESAAHHGFKNVKEFFGRKEDIEEATSEVVCNLIQSMTGIEPQEEWSLEECGLGSNSMPALARTINRGFGNSISLTIADIVLVKTIRELVTVIDTAKALRDTRGV